MGGSVVGADRGGMRPSGMDSAGTGPGTAGVPVPVSSAGAAGCRLAVSWATTPCSRHELAVQPLHRGTVRPRRVPRRGRGQLRPLVAAPAARRRPHGLLLLAQSRELDAIEAFRQALANDPTYVDAHNNLGYLLAGAGRTDEAIRELRAALQGNPAHRDANFNLARALHASGQRGEAIRHFLAATQIEDDKTPLYLYYLADAYARQGALSDAERYGRAARSRAASLGQVELVQRIDEDLRRLKGRSDQH